MFLFETPRVGDETWRLLCPAAPERRAHLPTPSPESDDEDEDEDDGRGSGGGNIDPEDDEGGSDEPDEEDEDDTLWTARRRATRPDVRAGIGHC
jgi:hypothetical protein